MLLLKIAAFGVAAVVALLVAAGVWMWQSRRASEADARAFCEGIRIGETVAAVDARAERDQVLVGTGPGGRHRYRFPGWGLGICEVEERDGRITSRRAWYEAWD